MDILDDTEDFYRKVEYFNKERTEKLSYHYREILKLLGEDPEREGLEKTPYRVAKAMLSIGAVKGFEIGDGFAASASCGSVNNDAFRMRGDAVVKATNHSGGVLGGISDGSDVVFRAAFKPTPSIARPQDTVSRDKKEMELTIHGRHDPVVVPRAVVVVEAMAAITVMDMLLLSMTSRLDMIQLFFQVEEGSDEE